MRIAWPSLKHRAPVGGGYCTTLTHRGNDRKGPGGRLAAGHGQRYGEAMVDRHFVGDGHVEFIEDQGFRQMPCECRMPFTTGTGRGPKPSSAIGKLSATPIRKVGMISREKAHAWSL